MDITPNRRPHSAVEPPFSAYLHARGSAMGIPLAGNFELTSRCNFHCKMCYVHDGEQACELSAAEWIALGREAVDRGMLFLLLTGGEPFLRPDFKEIYYALHHMGLMISINTNASLIDEETVAFLKQYPPLRLNISLYGDDEEAYRRLCGNPSAGKVKEVIRALREAGLSIKINSSITPYNREEIEGIYRFGEELGIPVTATAYMYPPVRINDCHYGEAPARFGPEEAGEAMLRCREQYLTREQLAAIVKGILPDDPVCVSDEAEGEGMRCRAGRTSFWITRDGRMLPCGMFPIEGWSVREYGFDKAWEQVKAYTKSVVMPKECTDCPRKNRCNACAAACFAETGSTSVCPEYICRMTKRYDTLLTEKYGDTKERDEE